MVHQPKLKRRPLGDVEPVNRLAGLHQAQEMKRTIQRADFAVGGNHRHRLFRDASRADDEAFVAGGAQIGGPIQIADQRRIPRRADNDRAVR